MLEVWWTVAARPLDAPLLAMLSTAERKRLQRLRRPQDRASYAAAHILLRRALASRLGTAELEFDRLSCPLCGGNHGRPVLRAPAGLVDYSLTHGGHLAVVAVCDMGPVGVDAERLADPSMVNSVGPLLHTAEQEWVDGAGGRERLSRFTRAWTRKEAYLKAIGTGLGRAVSADCTAPHRRDLHPAGWDFHELALESDHRVALCAPAGAGDPLIRQVDLEG